MDWLGGFFQANKGSLITLLIIVGAFLLSVKSGMIKFKGKGLEIGESKDRMLIRNQWEYAASTCEAQFTKIRPYCKSDEEAKYLIARVEDVFQSAIIYNFMRKDENYMKAKQALVLNAILKRVSNEYFFTEEFKACCNKFVENLIKDLVRMKGIK